MDRKVIQKTYTGIRRVYSTNVEDTRNYVSEGNIINQNCIIDCDYEGEMHINLINTCNNTAIINAGDKIVQMLALFQPIMKEAVEFESLEKLYENTTSERGADGFGSTDNK